MEHSVPPSHDAKGPVTLIFADTVRGSTAAEAAVSAVGGRVGAQLPLDGACARLAGQARIDAVLLDLESDHGALLDAVLDQADRVCAGGNIPLIIALQPEIIDAVAARISTATATLLCRPDPAERIAALSCAWIGLASSVRDGKAEADALRLRQLADEVARIAKVLSSLSGSPAGRNALPGTPAAMPGDGHKGFVTEPASPPETPLPDPADIRLMLKLRRLRESFFDSALFADPGWDMLLDLMAARLEGKRVAVSSLCIAAAVPPTTALRWIKAMTDHDLFERQADPADGRRIFMRLSDKAADGMTRYFAAARRMCGLTD